MRSVTLCRITIANAFIPWFVHIKRFDLADASWYSCDIKIGNVNVDASTLLTHKHQHLYISVTLKRMYCALYIPYVCRIRIHIRKWSAHTSTQIHTFRYKRISVSLTRSVVCTYHAPFSVVHTPKMWKIEKEKQQVQQFWLTDILLLRLRTTHIHKKHWIQTDHIFIRSLIIL